MSEPMNSISVKLPLQSSIKDNFNSHSVEGW